MQPGSAGNGRSTVRGKPIIGYSCGAGSCFRSIFTAWRGPDSTMEFERHDDWKGFPERFGYLLERFNELSPEQERQFQLWTTHLSPQHDWKGIAFLDAGCGAGRNSYWAMSYGARSCVAIDLDDRSLQAARR